MPAWRRRSATLLAMLSRSGGSLLYSIPSDPDLMPEMKGNDDIQGRRRSDHGRRLIDNRWRRCWLVDDCWRWRLFIDDRRRCGFIDHRWRWRRNDDRWRRSFIDDRWRTLALIGVMLAPFTALMLAPLMFAPLAAATAPTIIIGAGRVRADSA
jgi:hypothetical protein